MTNFDQFEISVNEANNVEGGTFGLLGLFGNCLPQPTCTPAPKPCYTAPKPTCPPAPVCPTPVAPICKPTISFSFSFSLSTKRSC